MTEPPPNRLDEILRLTSSLADQVLDAQVMGRPVLGEQALALAKAANLLHEYEVEWPPMLKQALHGLTEDTSGDGSSERQQPADTGAKAVIDSLTRFMGSFRR